MGAVGSTIYGHCRRLLIRYNAENRAHKFLDKGNLPPAPRHDGKRKEVSLSREILEDIHCKSAQLSEYLKRIYLTSTSEIIGTPSKTPRPKPKKENEILRTSLFYEPQIPSPGFCTLTNVTEILLKFSDDSEKWNINAIAVKFNLDKKDATNLVMYHSLFIMREPNEEVEKKKEEEAEKIEFEKFTQLEKKPMKQITS